MNKDKNQDDVVQCDNCNKEIPRSAALTSEGADYTWHFCGKKCFEEWETEQFKQ